MDRRLTVFARASLQPSFRLLTTFREPYFLGRKEELFVTAFREEEDRETFDRFAQEQIGPYTQEVGIEGPPEMTFHDVHNTMQK